MDYREIITRCGAKTMEEQLECCMRRPSSYDCTPEKCAAAASWARPSWSECMDSADTCLSCRHMDSYCEYRDEDGGCMLGI